MSHAAMELAKLRALRARPQWDAGIASIVSRTAGEAARRQRKLGEIIAIWHAHVPAGIVRQTAIISFSRGVLHVAADSSSAMYELDRLLRGGLTDAMRASYRGTLVRIKLRLADSRGGAR